MVPDISSAQYSLSSQNMISAEEFQRLLEISTRLSSTLNLDELLSLVMEVSTQLTDTTKASILLVDQQTGLLHFAASTDGEVPKDLVVPLDNSIAGWVVNNGRSVIVGDVQADNRFYDNIDKNMAHTTRSMLAVPLITSKGIIGALEVLNKLEDAPYTDQDVALMEALASQSAVAIVNARLFQQSDLIAEIMHELKTPLMAVRSASELLLRPDFPPEQHGSVLQMIQRESARLSNMTKDFLDYSRLESGRMQLEKTIVDLPVIISDIIHISQPQASERGITIETYLDEAIPAPDSPRQIIGDNDRLKQVMLNLVSNATKYNRENGRIVIRVKVNTTTIEVSVTDTGKGISEEYLSHLFERFYRIPGSNAEGSGLGLSIAKKLVEEHDGRMTVESQLDEGSTFTITLPLTQTAPETQANHSKT